MKTRSANAERVRVSLPASVASDIGSLKEAVGSVLDKLGCAACCSGHDIFFELQRDLVFKDKLTARAQPFSAFRTNASKWRASATAVDISISPAVASEIDQVYAAIDRIAELTGHPACATGCDMGFNLERSMVLDDKLNIDEMAMTVG